MKYIETRTRDFFDRQVTKQIIEKYGIGEMEAIREFLWSETYQMLIDPELEIYKCKCRFAAMGYAGDYGIYL